MQGLDKLVVMSITIWASFYFLTRWGVSRLTGRHPIQIIWFQQLLNQSEASRIMLISYLCSFSQFGENKLRNKWFCSPKVNRGLNQSGSAFNVSDALFDLNQQYGRVLIVWPDLRCEVRLGLFCNGALQSLSLGSCHSHTAWCHNPSRGRTTTENQVLQSFSSSPLE